MLATLLWGDDPVPVLRREDGRCPDRPYSAGPLPGLTARRPKEFWGPLQPRLPRSSSINIGVYEAIAEFTLGVVMCQKPLVVRQLSGRGALSARETW